MTKIQKLLISFVFILACVFFLSMNLNIQNIQNKTAFRLRQYNHTLDDDESLMNKTVTNFTSLDKSPMLSINNTHTSILPEDAPKILYLVRSFPGNYKTVLTYQLNTWMRYLNPTHDSVLVASINEGHDEMIASVLELQDLNFTLPTGCSNNHGVGLCCQESNALKESVEKYDFDWMVVIDDDVYLWPSVMRDLVLDYRDSPMEAIGTLGCVAKDVSGFCGGGGYILSREMVKKATAQDDFLHKYAGNCAITEFCDITTAWAIKEVGASLVSDPRLMPWGWTVPHEDHQEEKKNDYDLLMTEKMVELVDRIKHREVASLHYRGGGMTAGMETQGDWMRFLHRIFTMSMVEEIRITDQP